MNNKYSALIVDHELDARDSIPFPATVARSGKEAHEVIVDTNRKLAAIFFGPTISWPGSLSLIGLAHRHRPATPLFMFYDHEAPFTDREAGRLAISGTFQRSQGSKLVPNVLAQEIFSYEVPDTSNETQEINTLPEKYLAVRASDFLSGCPSFFDAYVRLPSGKFLKVLEAKQSFAPERVLLYLQKGVRYFYLKKESHERCLIYCDRLAQFLLRNPGISFSQKLAQTFSQGAEVSALLQQGVLDETHLEFALTFLGATRKLLLDMDAEKNLDVTSFLSNVRAYDHAVGVTLISCLLALILEMDSEHGFRAVGLASLFHDIGLYADDAKIPDHEDPSLMTEEEKLKFHQHPTRGSEIVGALPGIDPVVVQAVAQHHERRDHSGFPGKIAPALINRVAEIVGVSDEFVRLFKKDPAASFPAMEKQIFPGFSADIKRGFHTLFAAKN